MSLAQTTPDIMIDLETLGTRPGSVIVSIGAVAFNPRTGFIGQTFYRAIDPASCQRHGLTMDAETVTWWLRQGEDARKAITTFDPMRLDTALVEFSIFMEETAGERVWGHGGNFDEPLLAAAFRATHMRQPWKFWDSRCTRTVFELAGVKPDRRAGVHHNALDDARAQAAAVIRAYQALGLLEAGEDEPPRCIACGERLQAGEPYYADVEGGLIHAACIGDGRENFVRDLDTCEPLRAGDPIPTPSTWSEADR